MPVPEVSVDREDRQHKKSYVTDLAHIIGTSARFSGDVYGLSSGEQASLARMNPDDMRPHQLAALSRALIHAGLEPENWSLETWRRCLDRFFPSSQS